MFFSNNFFFIYIYIFSFTLFIFLMDLRIVGVPIHTREKMSRSNIPVLTLLSFCSFSLNGRISWYLTLGVGEGDLGASLNCIIIDMRLIPLLT